MSEESPATPADTPALTITIAAPEQTFRNQRLYLNTDSRNAFSIRIAPTADGPGEISLEGAGIVVDFGRMLTDEEVSRLALSPPKGFVASLISGMSSLALSAKGILRVSRQTPLDIPLVFDGIEGPPAKPYGTILINLFQNDAPVAAAEYDVSIQRVLEGPQASLPIFVAWDNGIVPALATDESGAVTFAIINLRCDRRGNAKPLVTLPWQNDQGETHPRIRLSVPVALNNNTLGDFGPDFLGNATIDLTPSHSSKKWTDAKEGIYREFRPDSATGTDILEAKGSLKVTIRGLTPKQMGAGAFALTFVDFPGYVTGTFVLPFTSYKRQPPPKPRILSFMANTYEYHSPGDSVRLSWETEAQGTDEVKLENAGGDFKFSASAVSHNKVDAQGCCAWHAVEPVPFTLTLSLWREGRVCDCRQITISPVPLPLKVLRAEYTSTTDRGRKRDWRLRIENLIRDKLKTGSVDFDVEFAVSNPDADDPHQGVPKELMVEFLMPKGLRKYIQAKENETVKFHLTRNGSEGYWDIQWLLPKT